MKVVPAPTEDTAGVELASTADGAANGKPEVLEPWVGGKARRECDAALDEAAMGGACWADERLGVPDRWQVSA
jgi:hypothetical protein